MPEQHCVNFFRMSHSRVDYRYPGHLLSVGPVPDLYLVVTHQTSTWLYSLTSISLCALDKKTIKSRFLKTRTRKRNLQIIFYGLQKKKIKKIQQQHYSTEKKERSIFVPERQNPRESKANMTTLRRLHMAIPSNLDKDHILPTGGGIPVINEHLQTCVHAELELQIQKTAFLWNIWLCGNACWHDFNINDRGEEKFPNLVLDLD